MLSMTRLCFASPWALLSLLVGLASCGSGGGAAANVIVIVDDDTTGGQRAGQGSAGSDAGAIAPDTVAPSTEVGTVPDPLQTNPTDPWAHVGPEYCPANPKIGVKEGTVLKDIELEDCDGATYRLWDFCGSNVTWVVIGSGWCTYCNQEAKTFDQYYTKHMDAGVTAWNILLEDWTGNPATPKFCKEWKDKYGLTMPVLIDPKGKTAFLFKENAVPLNFILDEQMTIRWLRYGFIDHWEVEAQLIKEMAHEPAPN